MTDTQREVICNFYRSVPATQGETLRDPHPPVQLYVGQVFANKDALYGQVVHQSAQQDMASSRWGLRKKNYRSCICPHEKTTGCDYLVRARASGVPDAWVITGLQLKHSCHPGVLAPRVGALRFQFREHQLRSSGVESETKSKTAISLVEQQTGVQTTQRSTNRTLNGLSDDDFRTHAHEWACLPDFTRHCQSVDPEGTYVSRLDSNMRPFAFFAPSFFKKQFSKHIRPMLGVDAAFTKTCVDHHIIIASSYDANSSLFPLAWAFASGSENGRDWRKFFECLKAAYPCIDKPACSFPLQRRTLRRRLSSGFRESDKAPRISLTPGQSSRSSSNLRMFPLIANKSRSNGSKPSGLRDPQPPTTPFHNHPESKHGAQQSAARPSGALRPNRNAPQGRPGVSGPPRRRRAQILREKTVPTMMTRRGGGRSRSG